MKLKCGKFDENKNIVTVNLESLLDNDFQKIKKYFHSFGFECIYTSIPITELTNEEYHKIHSLSNLPFDKQFIINNDTKLEELKYKLFTDNFFFTIHFSLLAL